MKLLSLFSGKDYEDVTDEECGREVSKVATDMVKVFDYSEGTYMYGRCNEALQIKYTLSMEDTFLLCTHCPIFSNHLNAPIKDK